MSETYIKTFSHQEAISGLCVWEYFLEAADDTPPARFKEKHGAIASRDYALMLGRFCEAVYRALPDSDEWSDFCYDWEIVPAIIEHVGSAIFESSYEFGDPQEVAIAVLKKLNG